MAIGEFGGAPKLPADGGIFFAAPMYWFYEMNQAALNPSRAWADATKLLFRNPLNPLTATMFGKSVAAACELFERSTRRYGRPEWDIASTMVGGERVPVRVVAEWERPFCRLLHFERAFERQPYSPATAPAHRRPDVRTLLDAAARHRRGVPAQPRRLHHRVAGRPHGAAHRRAVRSRRLHRLRHLDPACPRRRRPHRRGLPALGSGARGGRAHGSDRGPLCAALDGADGRPDRHQGQSDRREPARQIPRHRLVPAQRHHQGAVSPSRRDARCLPRIPAAQRLRQHEHRSSHRCAPQAVPAPRRRRRRFRRRSTANSTTSISP